MLYSQCVSYTSPGPRRYRDDAPFSQSLLDKSLYLNPSIQLLSTLMSVQILWGCKTRRVNLLLHK